MTWTKEVFTKEMVDRAYEAMLEVEPNKKAHNPEIALYGGEPLMAENYEIVKYIVDEGVKRGYKFDAITNAYDLKHFDDLLSDDKISTLQITLDGSKETHNSRRPHYLNINSFDKIIENIEFALKKDVKIRLRINTDNANINEIPVMLKIFKEKGFIDNKNFFVYSGLTLHVNNCLGDKRDATIDNHMKRIEHLNKYYQIKAEEPDVVFSCSDYGIKKKLIDAINSNKYIAFKASSCGAHNGMKLFDPMGDIYTCWEMLESPEHVVGTFKDKLRYNQEVYDKWNSRNIINIKSCSKCNYALLCGGGCAGHQLLNGKNFYSSNCDDFPKVFSIVANDVFDNYITKNLQKVTN
jgi:uncharacterized protein